MKIKDLKEAVQAKAIQYAQVHICSISAPYKCKLEIMEMDLKSAFIWENTQEGYHYWCSINETTMKYI